jgi:hypothetical protein
MLFENLLGNDDGVVLAFGVVIIVIVVLCIVMTTYSTLMRALMSSSRRRIPVPRRSAQRLPREWVIELFVLNALAKIDYERELEVELADLKAVLTKSELEELTSAMQNAYALDPRGADNEVYGDGSYPLETILPRKTGGEITAKMTCVYNHMMSDFQLNFNKNI